MSLGNVLTPYGIFTDASGQIISSGSIYIGVANEDPETNPIVCYWDAAGTIPASQPLSVVNGYIVNTGTPAQVFVNSDYSIRLYSNAIIVWTFLNILAKTLSGAAGGDLTGTYPSPQIAATAVSTSKIADHAVTNAKIAVGGNQTIKATVSSAIVDQNMTDLTAALGVITSSGLLAGLSPAPGVGSAALGKVLLASAVFGNVDLTKQTLDTTAVGNGYWFKIGSIYIQIGFATGVVYQTNTDITFPIAFPTACLGVVCSGHIQTPSGNDSVIVSRSGALSTTKFIVYTYDNVNHPNTDIDYIAIGH